MNSTDNRKKSIFITGAASGMGRATAQFFSQKGWFVGATDINDEGLKTLKEELGENNCFTRVLDVSDKEDYDNTMAEFSKFTGGHLDILFNNAGTGAHGWFEDVSYEDTIRTVNVNFIGVLNGIYAAIPLLKATPNSLCLSTSSSSATYGMPRVAVYAATKHAIKGLTEALSIEFMRLGIRAADLLPAAIDTPMLAQSKATIQKRGTFRLLPVNEIAETVWKAYNSTKLHWYVPDSLAWIDRIKGLSPELGRKHMLKTIKKLTAPKKK